MDTVKFIIEDYVDDENGFRFPTINIYINDKNLIQLVNHVECRDNDLQKEEELLNKQSYVGLHPDYHRDFHDEFLGLKKRPGDSLLLTCTCLEAACNSITAQIIVDSKTVTWNELKSPWLSSKTLCPWMTEEEALADGWIPVDYSGLGPFVFDREQYINALEQLRTSM